jgi:hypothetical protein
MRTMTKDDAHRPRHPDLKKIIVRSDKACIDQFYITTMQQFR